MRRRAVARWAAVGLVVSLAAVWAASAGVVLRAKEPIAARDARYARAERLTLYRVAPGERVRFLLPVGTRAVRLATHLELPPGTPFAAERQYAYGVGLRLVGPAGAPLLERTLFTRTRQSKQGAVDGGWQQEAAFSARPGVELTDDRELELTLPEGAAQAGVALEVRFPGQAGALLTRAWVQAPRTAPLSVTRTQTALRQAEARVARATFVPWQKLAPGHRQALAEAGWERLAADGEAGQDFHTDTVFRTAFRLPLAELERAADERLAAHAAVALNVRGPAGVVLRLWRPGPGTPGAAPGGVAVRALTEAGRERTWALPAPADGELATHALDLPGGLATLSLRNDGDDDLAWALEAPRGAWLAPEPLAAGASAPPDTLTALRPDVRRTDAVLAGPGCPALELAVGDEADLSARLLRLDGRLLGAGPPAGARLTLTALSEGGRVLGTSHLPLGGARAPYEAVELAPRAGGALPCAAAAGAPAGALALEPGPVPVTEPTSARLFLPPGTRRVRVTTTHPAAVGLAGYLPPAAPPLPSPPYAPPASGATRWAHAPAPLHAWHPLRPLNLPRLAAAGATGALLAQVRLEPAAPGRARPPVGEPVSLAPQGAPQTRDYLEPLEPEASALADPARTAHSLLRPGHPERVQFEARAPTRPELRLLLASPAALGEPLEVWVDGKRLLTRVLTTTRGRELLPPLGPGVHEVELRTRAAGLSATLNRPPAPDSQKPAWRPRTLYRLGEEPLVVDVVKPGARALALNVVLYGERPAGTDAPALRVVVDGGSPRRRVGALVPRVTRPVRTLPLPPSHRAAATPVGEAQGAPLYPRTVFVPLGEDLAPGVHRVRIERVGGGTAPLWGRFFVHGEGEAPDGPQQWNRPGWEEEAP